LRLIEALERMARQSQAIAGPGADVLRQLREIRGELALLPPGSAVTGPAKTEQ
jgi:hypothetical protein